MDLPAKWKLLWLYLLDNCDNSGVWTPNMRLAAVQIGEPMEASEALRIFAGRVETLPSGKWHIAKFVGYQYGTLSADSRPHQQVLSLRKQHGIDTLSIGYPKGIDTLQDKDKDKDKDQDKDKEPEKDREKKPKMTRPTVEEIVTYCRQSGLTETDGQSMFAHWESNGWKNGSSPVKSWTATVDKWKLNGWLPSQKANGYHKAAPASKLSREPM